MAEKVERTEAERAAFKAGVAAANKKKGGARKRSADTTTRRRSRYGKSKGKGKKPSGCKQPVKHITKDSAETVKIFAWRKLPGGGRQLLNAYLGPNGGKPKEHDDTSVCSTFVCNLTVVGQSTVVCSGVWSEKYKKLTVNAPGQILVANPDGGEGGYFGPGGAKLRSRVKN
jgi:hypothetical protein